MSIGGPTSSFDRVLVSTLGNAHEPAKKTGAAQQAILQAWTSEAIGVGCILSAICCQRRNNIGLWPNTCFEIKQRQIHALLAVEENRENTVENASDGFPTSVLKLAKSPSVWWQKSTTGQGNELSLHASSQGSKPHQRGGPFHFVRQVVQNCDDPRGFEPILVR
jgi:hypothetical protein